MPLPSERVEEIVEKAEEYYVYSDDGDALRLSFRRAIALAVRPDEVVVKREDLSQAMHCAFELLFIDDDVEARLTAALKDDSGGTNASAQSKGATDD